MEILALHDDHAHKTVAKDTSEEEEKVEECDEHQDKTVLHLLRTKDAFKALEYFCLVQKSEVAEGIWRRNLVSVLFLFIDKVCLLSGV